MVDSLRHTALREVEMVKGKYPQKVTLEKKDRVADGGGGWVVTWVRYGQSRCWIGTLSGSELLQAQQLQNPYSYRIGMPYRKDIQPDHRLTDEAGKRYNIRSVIDVNNLGKYLEIVADSGVAI